jgi:hypothetical protein
MIVFLLIYVTGPVANKFSKSDSLGAIGTPQSGNVSSKYTKNDHIVKPGSVISPAPALSTPQLTIPTKPASTNQSSPGSSHSARSTNQSSPGSVQVSIPSPREVSLSHSPSTTVPELETVASSNVTTGQHYLVCVVSWVARLVEPVPCFCEI